MSEKLPYLNIVLGLIGFGWLLVRTSTRWSEYPTEVRLLLAKTLALFFGLLVVSAEIAAGEDAIPFRSVVVISCVKVFALVTLWLTRTTKYRTGTRTFDGNPGADQNRDVA